MTNQHIVIVGGGLSGISFLVQLIAELENLWMDSNLISNLRISVIERQERIGLGVAYNTPLLSHIMNTRIRVGSVFSQHPTHLLSWLLERKNELTRQCPDLEIAAHQYLPRKLYSEYLNEVAKNSIEKAKKIGVEVSLLNGIAYDLNQDFFSGLYRINLEDGTTLDATDIVIATGDEPPHNFSELNKSDRYHPYPWPLDLWRDKVSRQDRIAVLGSGLTAIDVWLALQDQKHIGEVIFISRHGGLPRVQPLHDHSWELSFLTLEALQEIRKKRFLSLQDVIHLMSLEIYKAMNQIPDLTMIIGKEKTARDQLSFDLAAAKHERLPFMDVIFSSFPLGATIWTMLSDSERQVFLEKFSTHFYRLFSMPVQNAEKILAGLDSTQLKIFSDLRHIKITANQKHSFEIETKKGKLEVDHVINATGQGTDVRKSQNPLLQNLLKKGVLNPHPFGGVRANLNTFELISSQGYPLPRVYGLGPLLRGELLFTNGGPLNIACSYLLANKIARTTLFYACKTSTFVPPFFMAVKENHNQMQAKV